MAITLATPEFLGDLVIYSGGDSDDDNDVVIQTEDVSRYNTFMLMSTAGALDVLVSLDGTNYSTAPLSLADLGATALDPVVVTAASRVYGFRGRYRKVRVLQNGATDTENVTLVCGKD